MLILNFSHPLSGTQKQEIEALTGQSIEAVHDIHVHFDNELSYTDQARDLLQNLPIDSETLQTAPILVVLPSANFIAAEVLAWLHGRMGYFPAVLRIAPVPGSLPPRYRAAEIINLQALRDESRSLR